MSLRLVVSRTIIGAVILTNDKADSFTEEHAALLSMLREPFAVALCNSLQYHELFELKESISDDNRFLRAELQRSSEVQIIGEDSGLKRVVQMVHHVAPLNSPVLILGETGTGKEIIATAIHNLSARRQVHLSK